MQQFQVKTEGNLLKMYWICTERNITVFLSKTQNEEIFVISEKYLWWP